MSKFDFDDDKSLFDTLSREFRKLGFRRRQRRNQTWIFQHKDNPGVRFSLAYTPLFRDIRKPFILQMKLIYKQYESVVDVFNFWVS